MSQVLTLYFLVEYCGKSFCIVTYCFDNSWVVYKLKVMAAGGTILSTSLCKKGSDCRITTTTSRQGRTQTTNHCYWIPMRTIPGVSTFTQSKRNNLVLALLSSPTEILTRCLLLLPICIYSEWNRKGRFTQQRQGTRQVHSTSS